MSHIRAIPTLCNGVQFRSRLEAGWAAFFNARPQSSDYFSIGKLTDGAPGGDVQWIDVEAALRVKDADFLWSQAGNEVQWKGV